MTIRCFPIVEPKGITAIVSNAGTIVMAGASQK